MGVLSARPLQPPISECTDWPRPTRTRCSAYWAILPCQFHNTTQYPIPVHFQCSIVGFWSLVCCTGGPKTGYLFQWKFHRMEAALRTDQQLPYRFEVNCYEPVSAGFGQIMGVVVTSKNGIDKVKPT